MTRKFEFGKKRAVYFEASDYVNRPDYQIAEEEKKFLSKFDVAYRALVSILYNFAPNSGHPGGSISGGRMAQYLVYKEMAYELAVPYRHDADIISYAAGHKALGLYALWALRNECVRLSAPQLLAKEEKFQLRLEDLLGFRHNKAQNTPLFTQFNAKPLGGHPEPLTPFVWTCTGASGVGDGSAVGLAFAATDVYGEKAPRVHIIEGEGGLTAGRVSEAVATASTAQLKNVVFHIDWNEASIESERVTSDGENPGDYVQWNPMEYFYMHDVNVIHVIDGFDYNQIHAAHRLVREIKNQQPTAIIYRTVKGWKYGIEGKASHGAGHKFASEGFYRSLEEFEKVFDVRFPRFEGEKTETNIEKYYWETLQVIRQALDKEKATSSYISRCVEQASERLRTEDRQAKNTLGDVTELFRLDEKEVPAEFQFEKGKSYTTRGVLGNILAYLNKKTNGALITASADLYNSTNAGNAAKDFPDGFYNAITNSRCRRLSAGGICEDAMSAVCSGISAYGKHIGIASSYGAFLAFEHVAARLHAIGVQCAREVGLTANPLILFNGHAGIPTGEDGPTHADPQSLQLVQDNFPKGACITATPLEADDIWPLTARSLAHCPAIFAPFVVRPSYTLIDREALGIDNASRAADGVYYLRRAKGKSKGTIIVQGAGVGHIVAEEVLPRLNEKLDVDVLYVSSRELFELLSEEKQHEILPLSARRRAMGITDFTLPTLDCWLNSEAGRKHSVYPHKRAVYLGSGKADKVYAEAGLNGESLLCAIEAYVKDLQANDNWL